MPLFRRAGRAAGGRLYKQTQCATGEAWKGGCSWIRPERKPFVMPRGFNALAVRTHHPPQASLAWPAVMRLRSVNNRQFFAWITDWRLTPQNVEALTQQGGRQRWTIENAGFNTQQNGGYELEHVYGRDEALLQSFYLLLQIAHLIAQLLEHGSLLRRVARQYGQSLWGLYGSVRNLARRLLECLRFYRIPAEAFEPARLQIRLDSS
jgi:hypothetical protein